MISEQMKTLVANSSVIRAMFEEGKRLAEIHGLENVYDFSLGNPNVQPPARVKEAILDILDQEEPMAVHGYMNNSGFEDVREGIARHLDQKYGLALGGESIIMTCGAAGGLNITFKSLLNPGDEVVVFAPFFGEYRNYAANYNAKLVVVPADTKTFQPDVEGLRRAITARTKVVIVNSPNNPTGVVYTAGTMEQLAQVLREKEAEHGTDIFLVSDEPYRELTYDGAEVPYLLKYHKNSIIGYSYSKSLSLPGERIGYLVVNPEAADFQELMGALNVANRILGFVNAPSLFQKVVARSLDAEVDVDYYKRNRDMLYGHLTAIGISCVKPEGAFYLFPKSPIQDDVKFCEDAKRYNILMVPGSAFGCPGHVRIAYCISRERVENSLDAFTKLMENYK
ncbi:pyridoxal phosphate-dependent aminotransferase [Anaerotalea alkaliphila]|uniref:Aminotransferase n=1 Tax=Anaerotalea alkaliphila TaxID=2662126 RepID=A0A7X5KM45_9FIRM|nr:pyridoxal phosphate-dependent aminotransferase [Anaerotalea alkaliphila]NDL67414.1 pyridoxal phosphate-dependent aminotransferase [Anaerotalea alkaliphila]